MASIACLMGTRPRRDWVKGASQVLHLVRLWVILPGTEHFERVGLIKGPITGAYGDRKIQRSTNLHTYKVEQLSAWPAPLSGEKASSRSYTRPASDLSRDCWWCFTDVHDGLGSVPRIPVPHRQAPIQDPWFSDSTAPANGMKPRQPLLRGPRNLEGNRRHVQKVLWVGVGLAVLSLAASARQPLIETLPD